MNDNLCDPKLCVHVWKCEPSLSSLEFKSLKCNVMVVFLRTETYVNRDVHVKCNVVELMEKLLDKPIHENEPKTF